MNQINMQSCRMSVCSGSKSFDTDSAPDFFFVFEKLILKKMSADDNKKYEKLEVIFGKVNFEKKNASRRQQKYDTKSLKDGFVYMR